MEHYFELSLGEWSYFALIIIVVAFVVYLNWKDEKNYKKSIKLDETNANVRYRQTEILESGIDLASGKDCAAESYFKGDKLMRFRIIDDPGLMVDDTIIHIN